MYWNWDTSIPYIFFHWWSARTPLSLAFAIFVVFVLAFFYETVVNLRARYDASLLALAQNNNNSLDDNPDTDATTSNCCSTRNLSPNTIRSFTITQSLVRSSLFAFSNFYSLFLMMIFMTYNAYLCIALVFGAGTGHFWASVFIPEVNPLNRPRSCCN